MRIISDFKDYYDSVMQLDQDRDLIYIRNRVDTEIKSVGGALKFPISSTYCNYSSLLFKPSLTAHYYVVGFCGKIYGAYHLVASETILGDIAEAFCFNMQEVDDFIHSNFKKKQIEFYERKDGLPRYNFASCNWLLYHQRKYFEKFFQECEQKKSAYQNFFSENRVPIFFVKDTYRLVLNGCLKDLKFFKVMDPYTAYQELSMYLGGLASPEKPIPEISDTDLLVAKGFDKWSFKTPPKKKPK